MKFSVRALVHLAASVVLVAVPQNRAEASTGNIFEHRQE